MKNKFKLSVLKNVLQVTLISFVLLSCSKDEAPTPQSTATYSELPSTLIGTFNGALNYTNSNGSTIITNPVGTATLTAIGSKTYKVTFSNNVPEISNLKFTAGAGGNYSSASQDGSTAGLSLSNTSMDLSVSSGGNSWSFSGTK